MVYLSSFKIKKSSNPRNQGSDNSDKILTFAL